MTGPDKAVLTGAMLRTSTPYKYAALDIKPDKPPRKLRLVRKSTVEQSVTT